VILLSEIVAAKRTGSFPISSEIRTSEAPCLTGRYISRI
jgi:hypothetical protein